MLRLAAAAALLLQLPAAAYFGLVHQRCSTPDCELEALAQPHRNGRPTSRCDCMLYSEAIIHVESMHPTLTMSCWLHRGTISVMSHLAGRASRQTLGGWTLFLTPCHATPWYSHLHRRLLMRFLDCSPPGWAPAVACLNPAPASAGAFNSTQAGWDQGRLAKDSTDVRSCTAAGHLQPGPAALQECHRRFNASTAADAGFRSERQLFEAAPAAYLQQLLPWDICSNGEEESSRLPGQIVLFDGMLGSVAGWTQPRGYVETTRFAHAQFGVDGDREAAVVLLERQ